MKDEKAKFLDEIVVLEKNMKDLGNEIRTKQNKLAELCCPYKIGQIMECQKKRGWGPKEKHFIQRAKIVRITPSSYEPYYGLIGAYILKDGKEGQTHDLWEDWKPSDV